MPTPVSPSRTAELAHLVEVFEDALARDPNADPDEFLPAPDHPLRVAVLAELIRVDLEYAWTNGRSRRLAEYRDRFPSVFEAPETLSGVAFEEYRQRRLHGDPATAAEYGQTYGLDTSDWPTVPVVPSEYCAVALVCTPPPVPDPSIHSRA